MHRDEVLLRKAVHGAVYGHEEAIQVVHPRAVHARLQLQVHHRARHEAAHGEALRPGPAEHLRRLGVGGQRHGAHRGGGAPHVAVRLEDEGNGLIARRGAEDVAQPDA
eukprot:CAMPEP_0118862444 /NCGR_PEP_ID=MMETSP1163-20130328/7648_1 /TAXON_ID=124430 /ORGANISM="Phaeomonas parva, Strain CCMP2877" /LENGTH=107 /DNA_ID=CAMNT_0006796355 /DNA_START=185 /DNA_END=505 /DNA_ORIENTATION=-